MNENYRTREQGKESQNITVRNHYEIIGLPSMQTSLLSAIRDSLSLEAALWGMFLYTELNMLLCTFHLLARLFPFPLSVVVGHLSDDLYRAHGAAQEMPINKVIAE